MNFPSGDQSDGNAASTGAISRSASPPVDSFSNMKFPPARSDRKTIRSPSRDQIGEMSLSGSDVNRVGTSRATSINQISDVLVSGSTLENASRRSSREKRNVV